MSYAKPTYIFAYIYMFASVTIFYQFAWVSYAFWREKVRFSTEDCWCLDRGSAGSRSVSITTNIEGVLEFDANTFWIVSAPANLRAYLGSLTGPRHGIYHYSDLCTKVSESALHPRIDRIHCV